MWHDATSYVVQYSSLTMAGCRSIQSSSSSQLSEKVKMTVEKRLQIRMLGSYKANVLLARRCAVGAKLATRRREETGDEHAHKAPPPRDQTKPPPP